MPVQIFEQRDREFPAHSREVFEFTHTDLCAFGLQSLDVGYELIDSGPVNQHLLIDFDQRILFEHQLNNFSGRVSIQFQIADDLIRRWHFEAEQPKPLGELIAHFFFVGLQRDFSPEQANEVLLQ